MEFFIYVWIELATRIIPSKSRSKNVVLICKLIVVFLILYTISAFTAGAIMLAEGFGSKAVAIILIVSALLICGAQLILGFIFYKNRS